MEQWDNDFNFDMPMKRGASQYYLLHFGMPGTSRRTPKSPPSLGSGRIQYGVSSLGWEPKCKMSVAILETRRWLLVTIIKHFLTFQSHQPIQTQKRTVFPHHAKQRTEPAHTHTQNTPVG